MIIMHFLRLEKTSNKISTLSMKIRDHIPVRYLRKTIFSDYTIEKYIKHMTMPKIFYPA